MQKPLSLPLVASLPPNCIAQALEILKNASLQNERLMDVILSCETSVLTRGTQRHIPEDDILHSYHRENLKSRKLVCRNDQYHSVHAARLMVRQIVDVKEIRELLDCSSYI
jgi:hypothetical protein